MDGSIIRLPVVDSTNIYSIKLLSQNGTKPWTVVIADSQVHGKGQRGKKWDSEFGKNLLCSVIFFPDKLRVQEQFRISIATSLAVLQTLQDFGIRANIKWPNDILCDSKKIAGVLIENQVESDRIESCVIGLGLNVNQSNFSDYTWKATSMKLQLGGGDISVDEVLHCFLHHLKNSAKEMTALKISQHKRYNTALWNSSKKVAFSYSGQNYSGVVKGVSLIGQLIIEVDGREMQFVNGEIRQIRTFS